jgi:hypothetical protein
MKLIFLKSLILLISILFFQACSFNNDTVKSIVQTNSASEIIKYKSKSIISLIEYKKKLDIRNPTSYNKTISNDIIHQIQTNKNYISLIQNKKKLQSYSEYFYYAFSKDEVRNRNDFLIIGLYKLLYQAYSMEKKHQFTAMEYDEYKLLKLYEYLQVLRWKIRTAKDSTNKYMFITWQNNWQLELANKNESDLNIIKELKYIKSNKESLYSHSNFSFEILLSQIILNVEYTLKKINIEPYEMSASALKSFIFIL